MYEEIIRHLMKWELFGMILSTLLCLVLPSVVYTFISRKERSKAKRKNKKHKKTWKQFFSETPEGRALAWVIVGTIFFCIFFGQDLYQYLSLREDMINENYAVYTGEFEHDTTRGRSFSTSYVEFTDENREKKSIRHNFHIDDFQTCEHDLHDGKYRGTVVYSPSSNFLLWWDAGPIGD